MIFSKRRHEAVAEPPVLNESDADIYPKSAEEVKTEPQRPNRSHEKQQLPNQNI